MSSPTNDEAVLKTLNLVAKLQPALLSIPDQWGGLQARKDVLMAGLLALAYTRVATTEDASTWLLMSASGRVVST